jgi:voltage-gated potassium channel
LPNDGQAPRPYEIFALLLSIFALLLVATRVTVGFDSEEMRLIDLADNALCVFFFFDFLRSLIRAENRMRYFFTWGWIDLAASIPAVDALRFGRLARVVRVLRVLRILKAGRIIMLAVTERRRESAVWGAGLIAVLVVFGSAVAVLEFERRADGNIASAEDALWWAFTTVTTVGYGDRYPVTTEGRLVAVILMAVGVGLFTTFTGAAASWFDEGIRNQAKRDTIAMRTAAGDADDPTRDQASDRGSTDRASR